VATPAASALSGCGPSSRGPFERLKLPSNSADNNERWSQVLQTPSGPPSVVAPFSFLGVFCCMPPTFKGWEFEWLILSRSIGGAIVGSALWLVYRYRYLPPKV
jgi:hypothetical protein